MAEEEITELSIGRPQAIWSQSVHIGELPDGLAETPTWREGSSTKSFASTIDFHECDVGLAPSATRHAHLSR